MADFLGTRDSNVAISEDNAGRKVLILDTITQVDSLVGNVDSAEGVFDLGGTDSTSNPTNFTANVQSSGFYDFANTLSLDAVYDTNLGAVASMSSEDEYDLFDSGRGASLFEDAKAPFDGSPEIQCGAEVQVGFDDKKERLVTKSELGHFKNSKQSPKAKLMEFSNYESELKVGDVLSADLFVEGEYVDVTGVSKGKGFQGVVKRHGFAGVGQSTHGQHNRLRAPGSIGAASYPARVFKGMKMAGQTGNENVTVQNLKVVKVITEKNLIVLKGCVPGHKNSYLSIKK